jgi:hypothetical protein
LVSTSAQASLVIIRQGSAQSVTAKPAGEQSSLGASLVVPQIVLAEDLETTTGSCWRTWRSTVACRDEPPGPGEHRARTPG